MSCVAGHGHGLDPELLWLWCRAAATALIQPLAPELPYAACATLKRQKKKKNWRPKFQYQNFIIEVFSEKVNT